MPSFVRPLRGRMSSFSPIENYCAASYASRPQETGAPSLSDCHYLNALSDCHYPYALSACLYVWHRMLLVTVTNCMPLKIIYGIKHRWNAPLFRLEFSTQ